MRFLDFVLKNVLRRKVRTTLTMTGVAFAIAAVVALLSITGGLEQLSRDVYASRGVDMVVVRAGVANRYTSTLDESIADRLGELDGVSKVTGVLSDRVPFEEGSLVSVPLNGWQPDSFAFDSLSVKEGRLLAADDKHAVMIGKVLAEDLKKKVADDVEIELTNFKIVGIFESGNMLENSSAVIALHDLQELMERKGQVSEFQISLGKDLPDRNATMMALRQTIENLKDDAGEKLGLTALPTEEFVTSDNQIRLAHAMAWVTSAIALIVGSIGMLNTMIVSVLERTQEIGILRAIGWRKSRIVRMILAESFMLSFFGAVLGTLVAFLLIRGLTMFPAAQSFVRGQVTIETVFIGFCMSILVGLVGGAYPALRGAGLPPTEALRYE